MPSTRSPSLARAGFPGRCSSPPGSPWRGCTSGGLGIHLFAVLLVGLLTACQSIQLRRPLPISEGDWTAEGGTCTHTHVSADSLGTGLTEFWDYDVRAAFGPGSPLAAGEQLVVATRNGDAHVLDLETGDVTGRAEFGEAIEGVPTLTEGILLVPVAAEHPGVTAYDLLGGRRMWRWEDEPVVSSLCERNGTVFAADAVGRVTALDVEDGSVRWQHEPDSAVTYLAGPTFAADRLVAVDDRGEVLALDPASGAVTWRRKLERPVERTPAARNGRLFVPTADGALSVLSAEDGRSLWTYETDGAPVRISSPTVGEERVIVGGSDGVIRSVDAEGGTLQWTREVDGPVAGAPVLTPSSVAVGSMDEHVYLLDPSDGTVRWSQSVGGRIKSAPLVRRGTLIVLAEPSHVVAFTEPVPEEDGSSVALDRGRRTSARLDDR